MLEKLAKQTAIYGISTIVGRFLSYLLTPYYTRIFGQATYGIVTDVYALIPFALVVLTLGMESGYFRFAAKAELSAGRKTAQGKKNRSNENALGKEDARGNENARDKKHAPGKEDTRESEAVEEAKDRLFGTTFGITALFAAAAFAAVWIFRVPISAWMDVREGGVYSLHTDYVVWVAAIVMFDVWSAIPFARLRERGETRKFVIIKTSAVAVNVALAFGFGWAGLYGTPFGVGWVFVANLIASLFAWMAVMATAPRRRPRIDGALLAAVAVFSMPLLLSGMAGTGSEFIDRQIIKYLAPDFPMEQLGVYGAVTKIAVVMVLFTQMYRYAAEPFFLSNFRKEEFKEMNAAAMKYFMIVSMLIFLGIALFRDLFSLIVGGSFREGTYILPVILGANVLNGVWLNLSFWYKREERTRFALVVTFSGLVVSVAANLALVPLWGYRGAAWARLTSEAAMAAVSYGLCRRYFPMPYEVGRIAGYAGLALALFFGVELTVGRIGAGWLLRWALSAAAVALYAGYAVRRERIDVHGLLLAMAGKAGVKGREQKEQRQ